MENIFLFFFFLLLLISNARGVSMSEIGLIGCMFSLVLLVFLVMKRKLTRLPYFSLFSLFIVSFAFLLSIYINKVNLLLSFVPLSLWTSYLLFFTVSTQLQLTEKKFYLALFLFTSVCVLFFITDTFFPSLFPFLESSDRQFIFPSTGMHNHLGDMVGLGLISLLLYSPSSYVASVARLVFLPIIVISFTKSALLSLFITLICAAVGIRERRGNLFYSAFIVFYISVAAVAVFSQEFSSVSIISPIQSYMKTALKLNPKPLLSSRDIYINATKDFLTSAPSEYVWFGIGPGNYSLAATKSTLSSDSVVADPHNILLAYLVEGGIFAFIWIIVFFFLVCYYGVKYHNHFLFFFLYLFFLFQTDYVFQIPAFMFLFFLFAGQIVKIPSKKTSSSSFVDYGVWLFLFILIVFVSFQFYSLKMKYASAKIGLTAAIAEGSLEKINTHANMLLSITPFDDILLVRISSAYEAHKQEKRAVLMLEKLLVFHTHTFIEHLDHLLELKKNAGQDVPLYIHSITPQIKICKITQEERNVLSQVCTKYTSTSSCFK